MTQPTAPVTRQAGRPGSSHAPFGAGCGGGPAPFGRSSNGQRSIAAWVKALALACLFVQGQAAFAQSWQTLLPLVLSADTAPPLEGFVRIVNPFSRAITVPIRAVDDAGRRFGPIDLSLSAQEAVNFDSRDLEQGNASKGLPVGVGDGVGHWRLEFDTSLTSTPLALAYVRTADEFVTSMQDVVSPMGSRHDVPIFKPGSNHRQRSRLRLINPGDRAAEVTIAARDDAGRSAQGGEVSLTLPAGEARTFTAQELESGGGGFSGRLGNGAGKWRLLVSAERPIEVVNLLTSPTGHLANLSTSGFRGIRAPAKLGEIRVPVDPRDIRVPTRADQSKFRDCPKCPEMVVVPPVRCAADPIPSAGSVCPEPEIVVAKYMMGSVRGGSSDERPAHEVTIDAPFAVGRYEITFSQWDECHDAGGCRHRPDDQGWGRGSRPVVDVSWHDAQEYVQWLSGKTRQRYRLLSESEWEYVARAGTPDSYDYWWGGSIGRSRANCDGCRSRWDDEQRTAPVGSFRPNPFGLYDVHGNVWELVEDCGPEQIREHNYRGAPDDGSAWRSGDCGYRAVRGGGWNSPPEHLRSANRGWIDPRDRGFPIPYDLDRTVGFRVARTLAPRLHTLPLIPPASGTALEGFVRIANRSNQDGTVHIHAIDDTGRRFGPVSLSLSAQEAVNFDSQDLERGNASKGLPAGVGDGEGYWRLELDTALAIDPSAYIRTADGFVTGIHDVAPLTDTDPEYSYYVPFSNPGGNRNQRSRLRLINPGAVRADVWIIGRDDEGEPAPEGDIRFTLPAGAARTLTAQDLESGAGGFSGRLGDGAGKWQLFIGADRPIEVMSLLMSPTGHLANLSTSPNGAFAPPPPTGVP